MDLIRRVHMMREIAGEARGRGKKIGLVPTMGALHEGHLSLVRKARELADVVVVSVFVNPTQFGPAEDYDKYPRDLPRDADLCIQEGVDFLFAPEAADMYRPGHRTFVEVEGLSAVLEGASRPGHFRGVCTVVLKLFNIVKPHIAVFGQKDAQQAIIIRRMVEDLNVDVELVIAETVRHDDGLAMSSRNAYLNPEERRAARQLYAALARAEELVSTGERSVERIEAAAREVLAANPLVRPDYVAVVDPRDLAPLERIEGEALLALAAWVGEARLIDNTILRPPASEERTRDGG
ncbi:MAG: pantoate--beta-alanine ligase [Acidobacteria bacterium]|nr:MAG: pantoate--beta-alanine ligase [Acidobacteriota bacterium]